MAIYLRGNCREKHRHNSECRTWYYDFMIRRVRYRGRVPEARTKAQAERVEIQKREEVYEGRYGPREAREPATLRAFVDDVYTPVAKETTRYYSCNAGYETRVILDKFGDKLITEISEFEISKWLIDLRGKYAGETINHFIKRLRVIFNRAIAAGEIEPARSPVRSIKKVEAAPRAKRRLSREEEERLIQAARDLGFDYVAAAIVIRVETGLRPMEFARMTRDQVRLSEGFVIARSFKGRAGAVKERAIPLTSRAQVEFEKLAGQAEGDRIFPYDSIKKAWSTICEAAEVGEFWYRWLRDEAASRWAEAGIDAFTIAQLLGHSSPRTSMIYVKAWASETARKMEAGNIVASLSQEANGKLIRLPVSG